MKIVLAGGSGLIGTLLADSFRATGDDVSILSRSPANGSVVWDGKTLGPWSKELDGADLVINLAGRTVNCRLSETNKRQIMESRVESTRVIGQAIESCRRPPGIWMQMSTATIYKHRFDAPNDEVTGVIGGSEPDVPSRWQFSVTVAKNWEAALYQADTQQTRKLALRVSLVMAPVAGSVFDILSKLVHLRLGGALAGGKQYVSWIHDGDFVRAIRFLIERPEISGAVNMAAPNPLPQREMMRALRDIYGVRIGLPATRWMAEIGAFFMRTESELILKSRRVTSKVLEQAGFEFHFPEWPSAAKQIAARWKAKN